MYSNKRPWEYDKCSCGNKKQKRSSKCKQCSNIEKNQIRFGKGDRRKCPLCGGSKGRQSKICMKCLERSRWKKIMNSTLDEVMYHKSASRAIYNAVRKYARKYLEFKKVKKECVVCKYSKDVLDVAHFIDITNFGLDSKLQEINSLKNIMYLCPTHHKELDKKIIESEDLDKIAEYLNQCEHEIF